MSALSFLEFWIADLTLQTDRWPGWTGPTGCARGRWAPSWIGRSRQPRFVSAALGSPCRSVTTALRHRGWDPRSRATTRASKRCLRSTTPT